MEQLLIAVLIFMTCYFAVQIISAKNMNRKVSDFIKRKNQKNYEELLKYYANCQKIKVTTKLNIFHKIHILIDRAGLTRNLFINPISIILLGIFSFVCCYGIVFQVFKVILLSALIALPACFLPIYILMCIGDAKSKKIEKVMLNFLLQLKNYTQINNDILYAFRQVKTIEPLQGYIRKFLVEINSGVKFEKAMENLKEKITFQKMREVLTNMQYCYIHGGNFSQLMAKSYKVISAIQKEKSSREQETMSARIVLMVLIILDFIVYFTSVKGNYENYVIMTKSFFGNFILYWNFISIWLLILLMNRVKKLDY